jgi:predicted nuclease with TOPRIM domain
MSSITTHNVVELIEKNPIKTITKENEYNIENYNKLLEENVELKNKIKTLTMNNEKLNKTVNKLEEKVSSLKIPENIRILNSKLPYDYDYRLIDYFSGKNVYYSS